MAGTGLMERNTDATATSAPVVDTGTAVAAYKDANQGVLDSLISGALKRGSINDPKVRSAIVGAGDAYHKGMLNAIQGTYASNTTPTPEPSAASTSNPVGPPSPMEPRNYELPGKPFVFSGTEGNQILYSTPTAPGTSNIIAKDTVDVNGNPVSSVMPVGISSTPENRIQRVSGIMSEANNQLGPNQPSDISILKGSVAPVYTRDRRGNITGVAREGMPVTDTNYSFDASGGLMGTPSVSVNESSMTPDELRNYRTAQASTMNALANAEQNRIQDEYNKGMLSYHDKELALKRVELGNELRKWNMQYGAEMGDKHTELQRKAADIALKSSATQDPVTGEIVHDQNAFNSAYDTVLAKLKGEPAPPPTKEQQDKAYFKSVMEKPIAGGTNLAPVSNSNIDGISGAVKKLRNPKTGEIAYLDANGRRLK